MNPGRVDGVILEQLADLRLVDWVSVVGTVITVASAVFALVQARKALSARAAAEKARDELRANRSAMSLYGLSEQGERAAETTRLILSGQSRLARGAPIFETLQRYIDDCTVHLHLLPNEQQSDFGELLVGLRQHMRGAQQGSSPSEQLVVVGDLHGQLMISVAFIRRFLHDQEKR